MKTQLAYLMVKEKKPTKGSGNFKKLAQGIAKKYTSKGNEESKEIGNAIAAKIGFAKYGKKAMIKASK